MRRAQSTIRPTCNTLRRALHLTASSRHSSTVEHHYDGSLSKYRRSPSSTIFQQHNPDHTTNSCTSTGRLALRRPRPCTRSQRKSKPCTDSRRGENSLPKYNTTTGKRGTTTSLLPPYDNVCCSESCEGIIRINIKTATRDRAWLGIGGVKKGIGNGITLGG